MPKLTSELTATQQEVVILAPTGQDSHLIAVALAREGIGAAIVRNMPDLCERLKQEAGAVVVAEEALAGIAIDALSATLAEQEPWSDIPVIVLTGSGETTLANLRILKSIAQTGSVTLLERPFRPITLVSTLQVALRARKRQYQVRELLVVQIQATRIRDEFISIASHELKTPLTSLKLQMQINKRLQAKNPDNFPDKIKKLIEITDTQVDRLTRLVEDMLDITRINSGKLVLQKSQFNLANLVRELIDRFMPQLQSAHSSVVISCDEPIVGTWDRYRIEQVFNNLITNSIRYCAGKPLHITLTKDDSHGRLIIRDEGPGISKEDQERIFHRFERAVKSNDISGLGLGLYICRQIVEAHNGHIKVDSEIGVGSTFTVELPLTETVTGSVIAFPELQENLRESKTGI